MGSRGLLYIPIVGIVLYDEAPASKLVDMFILFVDVGSVTFCYELGESFST